MKKDCVLLEISSITLAEKAKSILKAHGISSSIHRSSNQLSGCGYHLKVGEYATKARQILESSHVPVHGELPCDRS